MTPTARQAPVVRKVGMTAIATRDRTPVASHMVSRIGPKRPFRHYLREWRAARGLSQQQLADRLETSKGQISRWESGGRSMSGDVIAALADALSIEPGDLFRDPSAPSLDALLARAPAHVRDAATDLVRTLLKTTS